MTSKLGKRGKLPVCIVFVLSFACLGHGAEPTEILREQRQLLHELGVERWHHAGVRGQGVKVVVLDRGFKSYRDFLGKTLPERVTTRSFREDGKLDAHPSQHGIRCAEVVHTLAPEAELLFANWEPGNPETFLQAVRWAKAQKAQVLTCSLNMPNWSDGEGGGSVHHSLQELLGDGTKTGDLLFCASVGNFAQRHWVGSFQWNAQGWHEWSAGKSANLLEPWGSEPVIVEYYGTGGADVELVVVDKADQRPVGSSLVLQQSPSPPGWTQASVRFQPDLHRKYEVRLRRLSSKTVESQDRFHVVTLGAFLEPSTAAGSITFPADGTQVIALGAVDANKRRVVYSACGPNSRRPKPDLMARVPFPTLGREQAFSGTSAAAPQAAALAALLWCRHTLYSAHDVRTRLIASAEDLLEPGHDAETGYGLLRLP